MRVLIIKTSSLGDIIHTLPALTDAKRAHPGITFDWVAEESFKEVPAWHAAVKRVIPVALRRWRKNKWAAFQKGEYQAFLKDLRKEKYDYVIDAQGLMKSAVLTLCSRSAMRCGLSWQSAREHFASVFYQKKAVVPWGQHAVVRARQLFAQVLDYPLPDSIADYGIDVTRLPELKTPMPDPYFVLLHGTTWETKHWPESYWLELANIVAKAGFNTQLLWGNDAERARAQRISEKAESAFVVPNRLSLSEAARVLASAKGVVAGDTGLAHLAAALSVPTVSLYGPSDPKLSGTWGERQVHLAAQFPCAPCFGRVCTFKGEKPVDPPCFSSVPPARVWQHLSQVLGSGHNVIR